MFQVLKMHQGLITKCAVCIRCVYPPCVSQRGGFVVIQEDALESAQRARPSHLTNSPANSSNHRGYETRLWSGLQTVHHSRFELNWQVILHGTFPTSLSSTSPGMAVAIMGFPDCSGKSFSKAQLHLACFLALTGMTRRRWLHVL